MIRFRNAALVTRAAEVLEVISESGQHTLDFRRGASGPRERLAVRARQVLDAVPVQRSTDVGSIACTAGLRVGVVRDELLVLHQAGFVTCKDGCWRLAAR